MGSKANPEPGAGVQSGCAEKTPIKNVEKKLSKPDPDESAKQGPRGEQSAGDGFSWKQRVGRGYPPPYVDLGYPLEAETEGDARERMSARPIGGERNYERDQSGGIATRGEFEAPVDEKPLPASEGLASRRRCGY